MLDSSPASFPAALHGAFPPNDLLVGLLEASLTGVALYTPVRAASGEIVDFVIELLNPAAQRMLGQPARPADTYLQQSPYALETGVFAFLRDAFETGELVRMEGRDQDGQSDACLQLSARRVGQGLLVSFADGPGPARPAVEDALRVSQARERAALAEAQRTSLHETFMQAPASVAILRGQAYRFDYLTPGYQALFPGRELLHRPLAEALPETVEFGFVALLDEVLRTGEPYFGVELPLQVRTETGQLLDSYYTFTYQPYREAGEVVGVSILAFEVTPQVLARQQAATLQAEASRRDAQLQAVFEQAPVAIAVLRGPTFVVELANPGMCELWGHAHEDVMGKPLFTGVPELVGQAFEQLLEGVMATGTAYAAQEQPVQLLRYGQLTQLHMNFVYQPLRDAQGHITGVAVVATDVSEQVVAGQLLALANEELTAANQAVGMHNQNLADINQQLTRTNRDLDNFVYAASHDLKQPVNNLSGLFGELRLVTVFTDPEEQAMLEPMIDAALRQLATTIDDLATVGQAQRLPELPPETVDLAELTQEVLQTLQPQVLAARARVTVDFSARPTISYTRANLRTVLLNLLSNAFKYADPARPTRVHLSLWLEAGQPVLLVEDNGLGFDLDRHRDELFHLFRRFHDHTEGTGVGLYLVNRIVQSNGGRVEVESEVGVGSTFRLYL